MASLRQRLDPRRWFPRQPVASGPLTLGHRRIFILPNKRGLGLLLLLTIQLVASTNYNNSLGFILTFLVGAIAFISTLYSFRNLSGLRLTASRPEPVFVGDAARFKLALDNPSALPRVALNVGLSGGPTQTLSLAAAEGAQVVLAVEAKKRGWLELPAVTVESLFPLGLFRAWSPARLDVRGLAYPRPAPDSIPFPVAPGGDGGPARANTDDFYGFQSYQPGDPLRRIHWKGVAKGQGVHVKEYRGEESVLLYLDWAQTPGIDVEARLSRLCRWALDAEQAGALYGLRLPGADIKPASGPAHLRLCLEKLALFGEAPTRI
ncbi:MAG: DUF58 domain-containing protein [Candidatus Methylumidiphilus sp.]